MLNDIDIQNIITIQIDSIEPFGDDATIPDNVTKGINVYQNESKTGAAYIDIPFPNAMNGENEIHASDNETTTIINKLFVDIQGPSEGLLNSPHRNIGFE